MHVLLIVADGELQMTRDDTLLLVITRRIARKLQDLGSKVLEDSSEVDYGKEASTPLSATWLELESEADAPGAPAPTR